MRHDQVRALLAEAPALQRASRLSAPRLPVVPALEPLLPDKGLRPGSTLCVAGTGATSLALALVSQASKTCWTAAIGIPGLGIRCAEEMGTDLDKIVVVPDPKGRWTDVLAWLIDAFDIVITRPLPSREGRRIAGRVRERDAVLVVVGRTRESDLVVEGTSCTWHGMGQGHGFLAARTLEVRVSGRGAAARPHRTRLWLPHLDGTIRSAEEATVTRLRRA